MRVIAGQFRGRRLDVPPGMRTRPITDRVKETLFNILGSRFGCPGALPRINVLDLFAGTGGLGIEAVSRGAQRCLFVEQDWRTLRILRGNLNKLGLTKICRITRENAWVVRLPDVPAGYGLVFLDPPYHDARDVPRVLALLERLAPHVISDGIIVFRHRCETKLPLDALPALHCLDQREIGSMGLWFFSPREPATRNDASATVEPRP